MESETDARVCSNEARTRVDVGALAVSNRADEWLVAYALGSCVGVAVHDASRGVGGLAHVQLPDSRKHAAPGMNGPWAFADKALPELFQRCYALGARKEHMKVVVAGGASILDPKNFFEIGRKNCLMVKKLLWQNGVFLAAERLGGSEWRTLSVQVRAGTVVVKTQHAQEAF